MLILSILDNPNCPLGAGEKYGEVFVRPYEITMNKSTVIKVQ
jgi:hypothetical protein